MAGGGVCAVVTVGAAGGTGSIGGEGGDWAGVHAGRVEQEMAGVTLGTSRGVRAGIAVG